MAACVNQPLAEESLIFRSLWHPRLNTCSGDLADPKQSDATYPHRLSNLKFIPAMLPDG